MATPLQVRKLFDSVAKTVQARQDALTGRTRWWTIVDAAGDETFENRMKGTSLTAADDAVEADDIWDQTELREIFTLLQSYFGLDLALASPYIDSYLQAEGFRVPYQAAEAIAKALGTNVRPSPELVFPKGTHAGSGSLLTSGMHRFGRLTGTSGDSTYADVDGALDTDKLVGSVIVCQSVEATPGGTPLMTFMAQDGTTPVAITVTPSGSANGQVKIGEQAIGSIISTSKIGVAATAQFTEGDWVLLWENADGDTSLREVAQVKTIVANTSLEFESALANTFTASGYVYPMFVDADWISGNLGDGKHLDFFALPDRIIAL